MQTPRGDGHLEGNTAKEGDPALRKMFRPGGSTDWAEKEVIKGDRDIQGMYSSLHLDSSADESRQLVQPDITFFHEAVPRSFHTQIAKDAAIADLLIVMGTSMLIPPVKDIPRAFIFYMPISKDVSLTRSSASIGLLPAVRLIVINRERIKGMERAVSYGTVICSILVRG